MKTLMINASPKKKMSVSAYFLSVLKFFTFGGVTKEYLRNKGDHARLLGALDGADNVVFCLPMYVDGVPSHVLAFMKEAEAYCREKGLKVNVYVISNGGFIEGNQNRVLMQIFENFCNRSGLNWCGGIGIGGGVMLNVMENTVPLMPCISSAFEPASSAVLVYEYPVSAPMLHDSATANERNLLIFKNGTPLSSGSCIGGFLHKSIGIIIKQGKKS